MFFQFPNRGKFAGPATAPLCIRRLCGICGGSAAAIVDRCEASASDRYGHLGGCCNPKAKVRTAEIRGSAPGRRDGACFHVIRCGACIN